MCHSVLREPKFFHFLERIDEEHAGEVRAQGCACGGVLHSARYPRKPRGLPPSCRQADHRRCSFCCARCRRRCTPRSVRYLGRRVYVGALVLLAPALCGSLSGRGLGKLCAQLGVPRVTLRRWRRWWDVEFPATRGWQSVRANFMAPVSGSMPAWLLARLTCPEAFGRVLQALRLIAPLSTLTEGRAGATQFPQKLSFANAPAGT